MTADGLRAGNLAARAGGWSARHPWKAILLWIAFVASALALGSATGTDTSDEAGAGESLRAERTLNDAFPERNRETVLVQSAGGGATAPDLRAVVDEAVRRLRTTDHVREVKDPYARDAAGALSRDGRAALISFGIPAEQGDTEGRVDASLATVESLQAAHPDFRIEQLGDASVGKALGEAHERDMHKAEAISLPITLAILVVAFGALVAASVPLLLGISAVAAAIGLIGPLSQLTPVADWIFSVVLLIGLAVGVDYSLFYLRREREERARGREPKAALAIAAATSGHAILVSGLTVIVALAGMYLSGVSGFSSFSTGTMLVVAIAIVGSLTVLPAVLAKLGDWVNKGRVPLLRRPEERVGGDSRLWSALLERVLRRPLGSAVAAFALLAVLAVPLFHIQTGLPGFESLPQNLDVRQTYERIQRAFPGDPVRAELVVAAPDVRSPRVSGAIDELRARAERHRLLGRPVTVAVSPDHTAARVSIPLAGTGTDSTSYAALAEIRDRLVPATVGALPGVSADATGDTAWSKDLNDSMRSHLPLVLAFVLGLAFVLLTVAFRSIVIPLKAIVLNLLSVAAALGVVTWVFQDGHGESLLDFRSTGAITPWLPVFLFVLLFGLSMDYHVFILSRVREAREHGLDTGEAVSRAIRTSAPVVTAAAVVMVAVFGVFATLSDIESKQFGVGLAVAILLDATVVRGVLLPAAMKLLGDWNWYLPRWLHWLPEPSAAPRGRRGRRARIADDRRADSPALSWYSLLLPLVTCIGFAVAIALVGVAR
jgi:uncharacterized membrane protein YdfJ with MMPL/SSD domain